MTDPYATNAPPRVELRPQARGLAGAELAFDNFIRHEQTQMNNRNGVITAEDVARANQLAGNLPRGGNVAIVNGDQPGWFRFAIVDQRGNVLHRTDANFVLAPDAIQAAQTGQNIAFLADVPAPTVARDQDRGGQNQTLPPVSRLIADAARSETPLNEQGVNTIMTAARQQGVDLTIQPIEGGYRIRQEGERGLGTGLRMDRSAENYLRTNNLVTGAPVQPSSAPRQPAEAVPNTPLTANMGVSNILATASREGNTLDRGEVTTLLAAARAQNIQLEITPIEGGYRFRQANERGLGTGVRVDATGTALLREQNLIPAQNAPIQPAPNGARQPAPNGTGQAQVRDGDAAVESPFRRNGQGQYLMEFGNGFYASTTPPDARIITNLLRFTEQAQENPARPERPLTGDSAARLLRDANNAGVELETTRNAQGQIQVGIRGTEERFDIRMDDAAFTALTTTRQQVRSAPRVEPRLPTAQDLPQRVIAYNGNRAQQDDLVNDVVGMLANAPRNLPRVEQEQLITRLIERMEEPGVGGINAFVNNPTAREIQVNGQTIRIPAGEGSIVRLVEGVNEQLGTRIDPQLSQDVYQRRLASGQSPRPDQTQQTTAAPNYAQMTDQQLWQQYEGRVNLMAQRDGREVVVTADGNFTQQEYTALSGVNLRAMETAGRAEFGNGITVDGTITDAERTLLNATPEGRDLLQAMQQGPLQVGASRDQIIARLQVFDQQGAPQLAAAQQQPGSPQQPEGPQQPQAERPAPVPFPTEGNARRYRYSDAPAPSAERVFVPEASVGNVQQLLLNAGLPISRNSNRTTPDNMWGPVTEQSFERLAQAAGLEFPVNLNAPGVMERLTAASQRMAQERAQNGQRPDGPQQPREILSPETQREIQEQALVEAGTLTQAQLDQSRTLRTDLRNELDRANTSDVTLVEALIRQREPNANGVALGDGRLSTDERAAAGRIAEAMAQNPEGIAQLNELVNSMRRNNAPVGALAGMPGHIGGVGEPEIGRLSSQNFGGQPQGPGGMEII